MDTDYKQLFSFPMQKWFVVLLLLGGSAYAQERASAYEALRVVSAQLGKPALNHVISMSGNDGDPEPETWRVMLEDSRSPTGTREVAVANGRVLSDRSPERVVVGSARNSTIKTSRLNLDSSGAFQVASHTADKSGTHFATASYTLRTDERGDPVWIVSLHAASGKPVGTIHINCNRGNVVRTEGMFAGANMDDVQVDQTYQREVRTERREHTEHRERTDGDNGDEDEDDERGPLSGVRPRVRDAFVRAQDEARGMFDRVRRSFDDFISR
jgi:hypothetical protein